MRAFLCGTIAGLALSWLRIDGPLGPLDLPLAPAGEPALVRALALSALALAFLRREPRPRAGAAGAPSFGPRGALRLAGGAALGYSLHAAGLADAWVPRSPLGAVLVALLVCALLRLTSGGPSSEPAPRTPDAPARRLGLLELGALLGLGAALAMALEALARWGRLLTPHTREDDAALAFTLLALIALGAASFGWLVASPARRAALAPALLAGAAAGCLVGWRVIGNLANPRGLERYFRHPLLAFAGLDGSYHGTLGYDLAIGASLFIVPALLVGAGLAALDARARLGALLAGAACGLLALPRLFDASGAGARTSAGLAEPLLVAAALCAALALLARRLPAGAKLLGLVPCALLASLALLDWPRPHPPSEPWRMRPALVGQVLELPQGVLAFEGEGEDEPAQAALLDGLWLAPERSERASEGAALALSLALSPGGEAGPRVLLVGPLTPERARLLGEGGATRVDRTASFHEALPRLERELCGALPLPAGEIVAPGEALDRWRGGSYDLVLSPPVRDVRGPAFAHFAHAAAEAPATSAFAWMDPRTPLAGEALGPRALFAQAELEDWRLAAARLADGLAHAEPELVLAAGEPAPGALPWTRLRLRSEERWNLARVELAARLARANTEGEAGAFCAGLLAFARGQKRSSPFEGAAERLELPAEALAAWRRAGEAQPLSRSTRVLWERLARALADKREIDALFALEPLVEAHRPWPELERALAYGELEALLPEQAAARLEAVVREAPTDGASWAWLGEARRMLGRHAEAAEAFGRAHELLPGRAKLEVALAVEQLRAGEPEGRQRLEALLAEDPEDEQLARWLQPGPFEGPEPGLRPDLLATGHGLE